MVIFAFLPCKPLLTLLLSQITWGLQYGLGTVSSMQHNLMSQNEIVQVANVL